MSEDAKANLAETDPEAERLKAITDDRRNSKIITN